MRLLSASQMRYRQVVFPVFCVQDVFFAKKAIRKKQN